MLWGLTLEQGKCYSQVVKEAFHITMAALDPQSNHGASLVSVVVSSGGDGGGSFVACTLQQGQWQQPLHLVFGPGDEVTLASRGRGVVHLTGYVLVSDEVKAVPDADKQWERSLVSATVNGGKRPPQPSKAPATKKQKLNTLSGSEMDASNEDNDEDNDEDNEGEADSTGEEEGDVDDDDEEEAVELPVTTKAQAVSAGRKGNAELTPKPNAAQPAAKGSTSTVKTPQQQQKAPEKQAAAAQGRGATPGPKITLPGGLLCQDVMVGTGPRAKRGKMVTVYYKGMLTSGKEFDSTTSGKGFTFRLGAGEVIKGWDIGIEGMSVGGKRKLSIPPNLAYGSKRMGPIPPNSTLNFSVELKRVS